MMKKISRIFKDNIWLSVVAVIILSVISGLGWKWSLRAAGMNRSDDSVNALLKTDLQNSEAISTDETADITEWYENLTIEIYCNQAYIIDAEGESVFGPCQYIYDDFECFNCSKVFRYVDVNGLIGYGKLGDKERSSPTASTFQCTLLGRVRGVSQGFRSKG